MDFDGHNTAVLVVKSGRTGMMHYISNYYAGRISDIEGAGDTVIAIRIPVSDEQDLNECIGAPEADSAEQLITERGSRYGKFKDGAGNHAGDERCDARSGWLAITLRQVSGKRLT